MEATLIQSDECKFGDCKWLSNALFLFYQISKNLSVKFSYLQLVTSNNRASHLIVFSTQHARERVGCCLRGQEEQRTANI